MSTCPTCRSDYPEGTGVCPRDGSELAAAVAAEAAVAAGEISADPTLPGQPPGPPGSGADAAKPLFEPLVGTTVAGRYRVVRKIGEGGMGAVYEAEHAVIGKRVAVKVLLEKFHEKSELVARLLQEARVASSIGHEHIVDVTDFGTTDDGRSFVVMEFLEGESLAQLIIRDAPLPVERSLRLCQQVASALGAAHAKGILHRDVKPENVYLIRRGDADFVKVVDFGIAKAVRQGDESADNQRLTHTGMVLGTPLYMSPEQARGGEDLDHRVDVWALGVMLYECLTGEVPFHANNYLGIISQVLTHDPQPPSRLRPELGIPEAVEAVVMRAIDKDRSRRYQLMSELERDLGRLLAGDQNVGSRGELAPASAAAAPRRSLWMLAVASAAVAVALAVAAALRDHASDADVPRPGVASKPREPAAAAGSRSESLAPTGARLEPPAAAPETAAAAGRPTVAPGRVRNRPSSPTRKSVEPGRAAAPMRRPVDEADPGLTRRQIPDPKKAFGDQ